MTRLADAEKPILFDGGMGCELRFRGINTMGPIWTAQGLVDSPDVVLAVHQAYLAAGATMIRTNT